ncbi:hypothetical protein vBBceHLY2_00084 [Bacillus phage vB_BceH_LY2]|nr:hypothetical protein vBBceHLY2_00084 [Bacillus phage vB_BceH_LY2]
MDISFTIPEWLLGAMAAIVAVPVLLMIYAYVTFKRG